MKTLIAFMSLVSLSISAPCTGKDPCKVCVTCEKCAYCKVKGNACGTLIDKFPAKTRDKIRALK